MQVGKGKKVRLALIVAILVIIAVLFPVRKDMTTTYYSKDGTKLGSLKEKVMRPWWMPESALTQEKPLKEADKGTIRKLLAAANKRGNPKVVEKIKKETGLLTDTSGGSPGGAAGGSATTETTGASPDSPGSTTGSYATIESKIPAKLSGYKLHTEQRSTLSWLGVFKSETDSNISNLDVSIVLMGEDRALKEVEDFKARNKAEVSEVRVEGLKAYRAKVSPRELRLVFVDGDFFYELDLYVKGSADNYTDVIVKAAEDARI